MNINQDQLTIFKTVIETGSFSAAARKLGKVPSAVSMSIANLEIDLNLQLFKRNGREPVPTSQAWVLYEKTEQLLVEINQWKQHAFALSNGLESSLTIIVVSELLYTNWTDYGSIVEKQFPELQINVISAPQEDALQMLINRSAQLALMFEREQLDSREQFIELKREVIVPVAAYTHRLAASKQVTFEDILKSRQIVVASRDHLIKPELLFSKQYWRTDNHYSACAMISQNLGWGILPLEIFNKNAQLAKDLKILEIADFTPKFEYYVDLVWSRETELGAAARFLIQHLREKRLNV